MVLKRCDEASTLAVVLSSTADLVKGYVNAVAANGVQWGVQLELTAILSNFPELEPELELLGSWYNADLMLGQLEAFWTQTRLASESL
jgi:hypothetical protein